MLEDISLDIEINKPSANVTIQLFSGDITSLEVDAIVNAAHEQLTGGGGVDRAIHKAAGPKLLGECLNLYGCPVGEARITSAYDLPCKYIIHTVGPVYVESKSKECERQLAYCYYNSLLLAEMQGLKSIAFPCISTGAFCFPKEKAVKIATNQINMFFNTLLNNNICIKDLNTDKYLDNVILCCFDSDNYNEYKKIFKSLIDNKTTLNWETI